jgi:hypothetical protein
MTLTELSYYSRKFMPFAILSFLILCIVYLSFKIFFFLNSSSNVEQKVYTQLFQGEKIQAPIVKDASSPAQFKFSIDTIEGRPVTATLSAQIFVIPPSSTSFGYREKILLMANTLGFDTTAVKYTLNDKQAEFAEDTQKLDIDISNFNFHYQYDLQKDTDLFVNTKIPSEEEIISAGEDFLKKIDKYPTDFSVSKPSLIYYNYNPTTTELKVADKKEMDSNMVEVDFFRPDIEAKPTNISTVTSKFPNSVNYVAMVFNDQNIKVVKAQVHYFETSKDQVGIYPLKTGDVAYQQLQKGQGFVINALPNETNITIKKMFLAYYDPDVYQPYLQPMYVFIGTNNFVGYVPAVLDSLLTQ